MKGLDYKKCVLYTLLSMSLLLNASNLIGQVHFYPPNWFSGFEQDTLEILIYSPEKKIKKLELGSSDKLQLLEKEVMQNPVYGRFLLNIQDVKAGEVILKVNGKSYPYTFKAALPSRETKFSQADVLYLITPDRFANGDPTNDKLPGFAEHKYGRDKPFGRHGGDIQGITDKLDYLKDFGATALWISPLLTNDQPDESYHGYAITNHYEIDPRFGGNEAYAQLSEEAHKRDLKMVKDMVYNHVGTGHFLFKDIPDSSFFNWHPESDQSGFRQTSYRATTVMDPHRATDDYKQFQDGWFVKHMPDLNQRNPMVARFLIQNSLWLIETYQLDAFRIDTYIYPDQAFMAQLSKQVKRQFPGFYIFGETWVHGQPVQSYFVEQMPFNPQNTHMDAVTDFQMYYAFNEAVHNKQGWTDGVARIYYTLAADYLYPQPEKLVTFLDNHDLARFAGTVGDDYHKLMLGYNWLLTMRGIPCIYYGSEIGMNKMENHGLLREDFPGGWAEDATNAFTKTGRSSWQDSIYSHLNKLLTWRANSAAIGQGKLTQFVPVDGVYVYFRHTEEDTVMVIANTNDKAVEHNLARYKELWPKGSSGKNVLSGELVEGEVLSIPAKTSFIMERQ
jgi:glycosidase